jgi:DNA-binding XRE family transcriptional regulator
VLLSNADWSASNVYGRPHDMRFSHIDQDLHIKCAVKKNIRLNQQKKLLVLLRGLRVEAGLTQGDLASRLGTDQTFISKYESGERRLDILELREVCQVIGIDFVAFIRRLDKDLKSETP